MSVIEQARNALEGTTPGPWVVDVHEEDDYDTVTVGAGTYLESPGCYTSTDLIHEVDTYSIELDGRDYARIIRDARFIAAARTLVPALIREVEAWRDVADERQRLIEQLKAEKRQLVHEVRRLQAGVAEIPVTVTRVHVIGNEVREFFADEWEYGVQDDGRTLKLYGFGDGVEAKAERDAALANDLKRRYCNDCGGGFPGEHECGRKK